MYQFERNSRIYMKGEGAESGAGGNGQRKSALSPSSRPASRSPMQELSGGNKSPSYHKSSQAIHNGAADGQHGQTKSLRDSQQRAISTELGDLTAPGETKTKTQMAREFQESQELYKSADSKAGLQTVKTRRVLKKTTTITRGENEKVGVAGWQDTFAKLVVVCLRCFENSFLPFGSSDFKFFLFFPTH